MFILAALILLAVPLSSYEEILPDCMVYTGVTFTASGRPGLQFYNACNERRHANACLLDYGEEPDLHQSFRKIPVGGTWTIYPRSDRLPEEVIIVSDPDRPYLPAPCGVEE